MTGATMCGTFVFLLGATSLAAGEREDFGWQEAAPETQGMSSRRLDEATDVLARKGTKTFLVIRNDRIVREWYAPGFSPAEKHYTASMAKALVGGVSLMLALNDGRLGADDPACRHVPQWKEHPLKSRITIRHLATHSSGIEDAEQDGIAHSDLPGWKGRFWKRDPDPFSVSRDHAPVVSEPGGRYAYSNPGMAMLSWAITASLQGTEHTDGRTLLRQRIMRPIGGPVAVDRGHPRQRRRLRASRPLLSVRHQLRRRPETLSLVPDPPGEHGLERASLSGRLRHL